MEKNVTIGADEGLKETRQSSPLRMYGNQRSGRRLGIPSSKPNSQDKSGGSGGKPQIDSKKKNRPGN